MTITPMNPKIVAIRQDFQHSYAELHERIDLSLAALDPQKLYQPPTENEWTIMQNLAHIAEFMTYWSDESAKLVAHPGQNFGRVIKDERRLQFIRDHENDTLQQIKALLSTSYAHFEEILSSLKDSDLALTATHPRFGEQSLAWFIQSFLTQHMNEHVAQLQETVQGIS